MYKAVKVNVHSLGEFFTQMIQSNIPVLRVDLLDDGNFSVTITTVTQEVAQPTVEEQVTEEPVLTEA